MLGGITLRRLLQTTPLSGPQAIAVGNSVLAQLDALHASGLHHGIVHPDSVRITGEGDITLTEAPPEHALLRGYPEMAADVKAAGLLICAAFGVDPIRISPDAGLDPESRAAIAVARAMASGDRGQDVTAAWTEFIEAAGSLGTRERLAGSHNELGLLARSLPGASSVVRPVVEGALQSARNLGQPVREASEGIQDAFRTRHGPGWLTPGKLALAAAALLILVIVAFALHGRGGGGQPSTAPEAVTSTSTQPSPSPSTVTSEAPPSASGQVASVELKPESDSCSPGSSCSLEVDIKFVQLYSGPVAWSVTVTDKCAGQSSQQGDNHTQAGSSDGGWRYVQGSSGVRIPQSKMVTLVATTTQPAAASSAAYTIGSSC